MLILPPGSTGGPDGLHPQNMVDLIKFRDHWDDFLSALTALVNIQLAGRYPFDVAPFFFGVRRLSLSRKDGGIRPVAIGISL